MAYKRYSANGWNVEHHWDTKVYEQEKALERRMANCGSEREVSKICFYNQDFICTNNECQNYHKGCRGFELCQYFSLTGKPAKKSYIPIKVKNDKNKKSKKYKRAGD